jgi:hypothetical protein
MGTTNVKDLPPHVRQMAERHALEITAEMQRLDAKFHMEFADTKWPASRRLLERYCVKRFDVAARLLLPLSASQDPAAIHPAYAGALAALEEQTTKFLGDALKPVDAETRQDIITKVALKLSGRRLSWVREAAIRHLQRTAPLAAALSPLAKAEAEQTGREGASPSRSRQDVAEPSTWQELTIRFTSDKRVQFKVSGNWGESLNYAELDFEDRRTGNPNRAWQTLLKLAESKGTIDVRKDPQVRAKIEKEIQYIRKVLRRRFPLCAGRDPLPCQGGRYQAQFVVTRSPASES